jgi:polar amino acid transport system substrate-binding protein
MRAFVNTLLITLVWTWLATGCASSQPPLSLQKRHTLIVGTDAAYPPMTFKDAEGRVVGIEADFARALSKTLHRPVEIRVYPWHELESKLLNGDIDIVMAGVSVTKARRQRLAFTKPWMEISQMALMRIGALQPNPASKGRGMRVGYLRGTTAEQLVDTLFPQAERHPAPSLEVGITSLLSGKTDYFFTDAPTVWYYAAVHPLDHVVGWYIPYTRESIAWVVHPDNHALRQKLNTIIDRWQANGLIGATINRWVPVGVVAQSRQKPIRFDR